MLFKELREYADTHHFSNNDDDGYKSFHKHVACLDNMNILDITDDDLIFLRDSLSSAYSNSTVNSILSYVTMCFKNKPSKVRLLHIPQCEKLKAEKDRKHTNAFINDDEEKYLNYAYNNDRLLYHYLIIGKYTLFRASEMLAFENSDIDFNSGFIHLDDNKSDRPHSVPMNSIVLESIKAIYDDNLFNDINYNQLYYKFAKAEDFIQPMLHYTPHTTRCHGINFYLKNGVSIYDVASLANHSSIVITEGYARRNNAHLKAIVNKFDDDIKSFHSSISLVA